MVYLRRAEVQIDDRGDEYPFNVPAVATVGRVSFDDVTLFVGDNGSVTIRSKASVRCSQICTTAHMESRF